MKKIYFYTFISIIFFSCTKERIEKKQDNVFYDNAFALLSENRYNEAFKNFNFAKDTFLKQKDSFGAGKCLINMAVIQEKLGDNFGSQETSLSAINYFEETDSLHREYLIANYNTLGLVSSKLQENKQAISFYKKVLRLSPDLNVKIICQNNLANAFRREKNYNKAIAIYHSILGEIKKNDIEFARTSTNLAYTKWLQNHNYDPTLEYHKALVVRLREKDNWGLNSSYAHLAEYHTNYRPDSALLFARKMLETAKIIGSPDDKVEALQKLISLDSPKNSKEYFKIYKQLNDSLQTARSKAKNQFALIRYEAEKNKVDFLKSKSESAQRQNHIIKQYFGLAILIIALIISYLSFRKRQRTLRQEKQLEVKNTELKYSKKVHDRVANKVYQVMSEVENIPDIDRNILLDRLEEIYEISRDITYEKEEFENLNFRDRLANMLKSYASDTIKIFITGNDDEVWGKTTDNQQNEVYIIIQELMTNMKKHSQADKVFLKFTLDHSDINISYTDNGIGIDQYSPKNGLQNTENRIKSIGGTIIFETETIGMMKIDLSFPV